MSTFAPGLTLHDLRARLTDSQALTFTIYGEARGETIESRIAVACCIRNRVRERRKQWGTTYTSVCLAQSQFSCWYPWGGQSNYDHLQAITVAFLKGGVVPWTDLERSIYAECCWVTEGVMDINRADGRTSQGFIMDRVKGATHYYAPGAMPEGKAPNWTIGAELTTQVGGHLFFKGVR